MFSIDPLCHVGSDLYTCSLACHTIKLPFRSPTSYLAAPSCPSNSVFPNPLFVATPTLTLCDPIRPNLARRDATSSFFHVVLRLRRLVESSREEIRKSWKAEYRGRERRKIRGLRRKEKLVSRIEKLTTRECESLLFGKLCLPVFPEEAFLLPRPLTRYSFPSLSLSLSFFPLAIPEKYFSSRTFSRVYAIPRSMRGMGEEEEGKKISAERRSRVKRAGRARNVCFFFSCLSRPPLSAKLSVEVSAHNQFMEHREATVLARARERKRERMEGG